MLALSRAHDKRSALYSRIRLRNINQSLNILTDQICRVALTAPVVGEIGTSVESAVQQQVLVVSQRSAQAGAGKQDGNTAGQRLPGERVDAVEAQSLTNAAGRIEDGECEFRSCVGKAVGEGSAWRAIAIEQLAGRGGDQAVTT